MNKSRIRRILLLVGCAVLLVCLSVGATLAYLTSQTGVVKNTFTVGNVTITLDEVKVDVYGKADTTAERVIENTYKLIPGHHYTKDPTIHVQAGSEKCWLFVKVENDIVGIEKETTIAAQMSANNWKALEVNGMTVENVYYYDGVVDASAAQVDQVVFSSFDLMDGLQGANLTEYNNNTITVQAYAVQADGFDTAAAAWEAAPCTWGGTTP